MSKREALKEMITQDLVAFLVQDNNIDIVGAMEMLYGSKVYDLVQDDETGLYLEGSAYIYDLLKNEHANGKLVQEET